MAGIGDLKQSDLAVAAIDPKLLSELIRLASSFRSKTPDQVATRDVLDTRREFLRESLGEEQEARKAYERILGGDELQPINYLERGAIAARAVAKINIGSGSGTGFLIAPQVLITNHHVLGDADAARRSIAEFCYEVDVSDQELDPIEFALRPDQLFYTREDLDYTVVAVEPKSRDGVTSLSDFGCLPLIEATGKTSEGEWLTVIQHPGGKRKQICVRENQFIKRGTDVIWYTTDTLPGASGSPVFSNDWYVVALHHAGVEARENGVILRNSDGSPKWIANEGIRVSRIVATLKQQLPDHPLLKFIYAATPASARITGPSLRSVPAAARPKEAIMYSSKSLAIPVELRVQLGPDGTVDSVTVGGGRSESTFVVEASFEARKPPPARFDAPFDEDYSKRRGYNEDFLSTNQKHRVPLPVLGSALQAVAAPLLKPKGANKYVLDYHNFSVVVHAARRLPIFSAANVSFADRFEMSRPADVWRRDPRILAEHQLENWYYKSNSFDRGHMTRREDLEFGKNPKAALASAADTCHWSNCVPQHSRFNQNKEIWQGIERYLLEESIVEGQVNAQIITGPVLDQGDPEYRKIQYPLQFWKIVAALNSSGNLFATAYIASQEEVIAQFGIEITEVPFGAYKTYQTKIAEIERLTGLQFVCGPANALQRLKDFDPLEHGPARRPRRPRPQEATAAMIPKDYYEIRDLEDIQV